jgi:hypothetical protein
MREGITSTYLTYSSVPAVREVSSKAIQHVMSSRR